MSQALDRRRFLLAGTAGLAGMAVPALRAGAHEPRSGEGLAGKEVVRLQANYIIQPGLISRIESGDRITVSAPWAVPESYAGLASSLQEASIPKMKALSTWLNASDEERTKIPFSGPLSLDETIRLPILGGLPMTNLLSEALGVVTEGGNLSLSLAFSEDGSRIPGRVLDVSSGLPAIVTKLSPAERPGESNEAPTLGEKATIKVPFTKWQFTIKAPHKHTLGKCVTQEVNHFNLVIQRAVPNRPGRYDDVKNFHLGTNRSGGQRCFVLWNSVEPGVVCWKKCSPKSNDLKEMLAWSLLVAAAIVGVYVSASAAATMAATAAAVFFPILVVL